MGKTQKKVPEPVKPEAVQEPETASVPVKPEAVQEPETASVPVKPEAVQEPETASVPGKKISFANCSIPELIASLEGPGVKIDRFSSGSKAEIMARHLAKQEKVRTIITLDPKEHRGVSTETANLNGLRFVILKGTYVSLPLQVAQLIEDSQQATARAESGADVPNQQNGTGIGAERDDNANLALH